jgi:hypothetical protein
MSDNNNDTETKWELIGVYLPAIVLAVWSAVAAIWGFNHSGFNVVMMFAVTIAVIVAETVRRRRYRRRVIQRRQRERRGPIPTD